MQSTDVQIERLYYFEKFGGMAENSIKCLTEIKA